MSMKFGLVINFKMPAIVGILQCMTRKKNDIAYCYEQVNCLICLYSKTLVKWPLSKRPKIGFQDQLLLNAGKKVLQNGAFCNTFDLHKATIFH